MEAAHLEELRDLLRAAGVEADPADFRRYGSARSLYHFNADKMDSY